MVRFSVILILLAGCGKDDSKDDASVPANSAAFTPIDAVLAKRCGGTTCHASGSSNKNYVGNEALFLANKTSIESRVVTEKNMPPSNASAEQKAMTADERKVIEDFIAAN